MSAFETSVEAQIASVADRIAYSCHDLEDAIGAEFVDLEDLTGVTLWRNACAEATEPVRSALIFAIRRLVLNALLNDVLLDVIAASQGRLAGIESREQLEATPAPVVAPSAEVDVDSLPRRYRTVVRRYFSPD